MFQEETPTSARNNVKWLVWVELNSAAQAIQGGVEQPFPIFWRGIATFSVRRWALEL